MPQVVNLQLKRSLIMKTQLLKEVKARDCLSLPGKRLVIVSKPYKGAMEQQMIGLHGVWILIRSLPKLISMGRLGIEDHINSSFPPSQSIVIIATRWVVCSQGIVVRHHAKGTQPEVEASQKTLSMLVVSERLC
jgi:hypothetical protein